MSKKLKLAKKGIIPDAMNGKVFTSLSDLGRALGFKPSEPPTPKSMKCRKCGTVMRNVPGTNVWFCEGLVEVEDEDSGVKTKKACGNRVIASMYPAPRNSEKSGDSKPKQKYQGKPAGKPAQAASA